MPGVSVKSLVSPCRQEQELTEATQGQLGAMPRLRAAGLAVLAAQAVAAGEGLGDVQC